MVSDETIGKKKKQIKPVYVQRQEQIKLLIMSVIYHFPNRPHFGKIRKVIGAISRPYGTA